MVYNVERECGSGGCVVGVESKQRRQGARMSGAGRPCLRSTRMNESARSESRLMLSSQLRVVEEAW